MEHTAELARRIRSFVAQHVVAAEAALDAGDAGVLAELRQRAVAEQLFALPLPVRYGGAGLSLADYLAVAEPEGRSDYGPEVLNSACLLTVRMLAQHAD